jgi:hypothetical protein
MNHDVDNYDFNLERSSQECDEYFSTKALALYVVMGYGQGISNFGRVLVCKN